MSGFAPEWLAVREPVDARSRAAALVDSLRERLAVHETLEVVDLGSGTGANLRYLAPRLGGRQDWQLVDDDPRVLAAAESVTREWAHSHGARFIATADGFSVAGKSFQCRARLVALNLASELDELQLPVSGLVTASALLDLVSEPWLRRVAAHCRDIGATVLFALTYDGRMRFEPAHAGDENIRTLVNRHQRTDKGFGPALGPAATATAQTIFTEFGYRVGRERSDWRLGRDDRQLCAALLDGWLEAAVAMDAGARSELSQWHGRRSAMLDTSGSQVLVGHEDLLAWRPDSRHPIPPRPAPSTDSREDLP